MFPQTGPPWGWSQHSTASPGSTHVLILAQILKLNITHKFCRKVVPPSLNSPPVDRVSRA